MNRESSLSRKIVLAYCGPLATDKISQPQMYSARMNPFIYFLFLQRKKIVRGSGLPGSLMVKWRVNTSETTWMFGEVTVGSEVGQYGNIYIEGTM